MAERARKTVLFLCTGNYFRSRFAEILFNSVAGKLGLPWQALSRGLALERGVNNIGPIAAEAIRALEGLSVRDADASGRFPVQVTAGDFEQADCVIAVKHSEHLPLLIERFPAWVEKVEFWHVEDVPEAVAVVEQEVMGLVARMLGGTSRPDPPDLFPASPPSPVSTKKPVTVKVGRETAGRRGKEVTTVFDTRLSENALRELATTLKNRCGTGGTVKEGRIEIQGDQRERIIAELERLGYKVKRVGG